MLRAEKATCVCLRLPVSASCSQVQERKVDMWRLRTCSSADSVTFSVPDKSVDMNSRSPVLSLTRWRQRRRLGERSKKRGGCISCVIPAVFRPSN